MQPCLFSQSLFPLSLSDAIRATAEAGFSAIELACTAPHLDLHTAGARAGEVAREIRDSGLTVAALSLFNSFTDCGQLPGQTRAAGQFIALAPVFETTIVKLTPGPPASAGATEAHWQCLAAALAELVPLAQAAGVQLAFETHMRQLTDTLASCRRFLDMAPADCVGLTVDFSNLRFAGETLSEALRHLAPRMFHTHVKNGFVEVDGTWRFGALDTGLTDYSALVALLDRSGYEGYLSIECLGPEARTHPVATATRDLAILSNYLREAGGENESG